MSVTDPRNNVPLTDRVNAEPAILRGLSSTEAVIAIAVSFAIWIPISLVIAFAVGHMQVSVIFMGAGPIASVWLLSGWFQKVKRDQPDYVYLHKYRKWMAAKGLSVPRFLSHSGYFDIGRSVPNSRNRSY